MMDPDNLVAAVKPILDAMRRVRYIRNDDAKWLELGPIGLTPRAGLALLLEGPRVLDHDSDAQALSQP